MKAMKKLIAAASMAVLTLAGCQQEEFDDRRDSDNYYASMETFGSDTKTALGESRSVVWSSEDRIAIFEGNDAGQAYQVLNAYVGKSSGEVEEVEGLVAEGIGASLEGTIAVYPFNEDLSVTSGDNGDYIMEGITFPSEQKYIAGSFSDEAFPMTAICENGNRNLSFKNIGGVLKLSLTGSYSVSQITLTGNSGELLSGSAIVTLDLDGIPSVTMPDDASTSVSLVCDPAVQLDPETATDFYISIPPTDFESGFKVTILDREGKEHGLATHKTNPAERSSILAMPESTPESMDDIELTADTFCSVDFIEGWTETRFGGDGTIVFVKEDELGRMTHSLMFLPDEENILMPVYIRYDENEIPSYMSFMDTEICIDGYTDSTLDFTLAVEDAVWSIKDVPCNELMPYSLQTRAWSDNNAIRNACAIGELIVGVAGVAGGVVMISASGIGAAMTAGASTPISVPGIALGLMNIKGGCESIAGSLETIFGPAEQKQSTYVKDGLMGIGMEKFSDWIQDAPKKDYIKKILPAHLLKDPADLGKLGTITYWSGFIFSSIDEEWGETYTGPVNLAQVHQDVNVVTGRADNITEDSAELYGYVSPVATAPFGERILTEIYIVLWKAGDENNKRHHSIFNSEGGTVSFTFTGLEPDTEYCYQTLFEDLENGFHRFGEVRSFKTKGEESTLREQLIKLYNDTDGDNWTNNRNWCSDKPIEEWYGVDRTDEDYYIIRLGRNNLVGDAVLNNPEIKCILVDFNQLTSLDVSGCTALTELDCNYNQLTSLDASGCTALTEFDCDFNQLTSLDVSGCTALTHLDCRNHQLTSLDVSGCTALRRLDCYHNQLTSLDISSCTALTELFCYANQLTSLDVSGCTALTYLDCRYNQLTSLDVSGCTALTYLNCRYNQLTSLDVSGYTALTYLDCGDNQLTSLDASGCTALTEFDCEFNQLTSLDVSGCTALTHLDCGDHQLTSLDVSGCTALRSLDCYHNQLTSLDISSCTALRSLYCGSNQLTSLDISRCTALRILDCGVNQLTSLDISSCTALTKLECNHNQLTALDASGCTALTKLDCQYNQLTSLDVSGCTALTELDCSYNQLTSLDVSGYTALESVECSENPFESINLSGCRTLSEFDIPKCVSSLNLSGCTALITLHCNYTQLTSLNLSGCTALTYLGCAYKQLTSLDVSGCTALTHLDCYYNQLTSLDVSGCTALTHLDCEFNQLTSLDISSCTVLETLHCRNNLICQEIPTEFDSINDLEFDKRYTGYWHEWHYDEDGHKCGCDWHYTDKKIGWWYPGEPESYHSKYH